MKTFKEFAEQIKQTAFPMAAPHTVYFDGKKKKLPKGTAIAVGRSSSHGGGSDGSGGDGGDGE